MKNLFLLLIIVFCGVALSATIINVPADHATIQAAINSSSTSDTVLVQPGTYFEDIDYCRQTWKMGKKVYYLPESVITHYHGATFKKLSSQKDRWKRLIPSSKVYHGILKHYVINVILWTGQKWQKILSLLKG